MRWALLAVVGASLVAGACSYWQPAPYRASLPSPPAHTPDVGRFLYLRDCAWCHGERGAGTERAPDVVSGTRGAADVDFVLRTGRMPLAHPDEAMRRGAPAYSDGQIRAIVAYVETFNPAGPPVPHPRPDQASLPKGAELYLENCAACHSTTAIGGALARGEPGARHRSERTATFAPDLSRATPREIAEAVRVGPGTMPVFGPQSLSDHDVDAIVRYVGYLQHPRDRGGLSIGRIGPVAEGAVAWLFGLGLLLTAARRIGTRS